MYQQTYASKAVYGNGENLLICGDLMHMPQQILDLRQKVQCIYVDPPFMTGNHFQRKRPYGAKGWRKGSPVVSLPGFEDAFPSEEEYMKMLTALVEGAAELLKDDGTFCLHLDWRMSAQARLLCDQVFGKDNFLNEIIWSYESGGRTKRCFARKHDTLLLYAKSPRYFFDLTRVPLLRTETRKNHMARGVDEDGRTYSKIISGGKEYRYYDDEPVYPGDVWSDIGFLQQRDPERSGYATQKPLKLLERVLLPLTQPGDLVVDLCCGSGTTLVAAQKLGCRFVGMDISPEAIAVSLSRLERQNLTVICPCTREKAELLLSYSAASESLRLEGLRLQEGEWAGTEEELVECWETGTVTDECFTAEKSYQRSFQEPELTYEIQAKQGEVKAIMVTDALGHRRLFEQAGELPAAEKEQPLKNIPFKYEQLQLFP